ncbi:Chitinase ChiA [Andreprevotia sp. IGB-42]|uniref:carboxypeptidase regulatory-like domain-containing protein n=1 Tax=Andreprevotia sp. IGB-42 TaxID=2497473 RepID=UPI0013578A4C|nr:carboxypeptidase regulatory-like domain-containing protein [Andreprevotia sp. IGB-42]KAF0813729.1 Chitinase ChiA [Andreprevotia sp. IGB-42]
MGMGKAGRLGRWGVVAAFLLLSGLAVALTLSPAVQKGLTWLQAQVKTDGSLQNEADSVATPLQSRAETLRTLQLLASAAPSALLQSVAGETDSNTEYLARQVLALGGSGQDVSARLALLAGRQNTDGGYGAAEGHPSNALDSAWALAALSSVSQGQSAAASAVRLYLINQLQADGAMPAASDAARIQASALTLIALAMTTPDLNVSTTQGKLATWLASRQGNDGAWLGDTYLTAYALAALAPISSDQVLRGNASAFLLQGQNAAGGWKDDPFLTAVVLRVLSGATDVAPVVGAAISGQLIDSGGNALPGASVVLNSQQTTQTDSSGRFKLAGLNAGSYAAAYSKAGYTGLSKSYTLAANQNLDVGTLQLTNNPTTAIVRGHVTTGAQDVAVKGASVSIVGASTLNAVTDANGNYEISGVTPGNLGIVISASGLQAAQATATGVAGQTLVFSPKLFAVGDTVPGSGHLFGKVVAAGSGKPLAGVTLVAAGKTLATTAANGQFAVDLTPGNYPIAVALAGYKGVSFDVTLPAGSNADAGTIQLQSQQTTTSMTGKVTRASDGQPVYGAKVEIIGGASATTNAAGQYSLAGLSGSSFPVRISSAGYVTQSWSFELAQPADVERDFSLSAEASKGTLDLSDLVLATSQVPAATDVRATATISNSGADAVAGAITLQILSADGKVVSSGTAYQADGATPLGIANIAGGAQQPVVLRWNSGQFAAGTYTLIARISEAGTLSRDNLLGRVLATRQVALAITGKSLFSGSVAADPPVLQANSQTPVNLTAVLQNSGNIPLPAADYTLRIRDKKTAAVVVTKTASGALTAPAGLLSLDFGSWQPAAAAEYLLEVTAADPAFGQITGAFYVGDAAKASFSVDKSTVLPGNQNVHGTVKITGMDVVNGSISDPLAPLIKTAVQKAMDYNNPVAAGWLTSNKCLGCHVGAQAFVGDALTQKIATTSPVERTSVFNSLITSQQADGSVYASHSEFRRTQTMLAMWAFTSVPEKQKVIRSILPGAQFLIDTQGGGGDWWSDYTSGWFNSSAANTAFNVGSLAKSISALASLPASEKYVYQSQAMTIPGYTGGFSKYRKVLRQSNGDLYFLDHESLKVIHPDGTYAILMSGLSNTYSFAIRPDGAIYVTTAASLVVRKPDGTVRTDNAVKGTDVIFDGAGIAYVTDCFADKILKILPDGTVSEFMKAGPLNWPYSLALDGEDLLVLNAGGRNLLRVKPEKTTTVLSQFPMANPDYIRKFGDTWYVSTDNGLYQLDKDWIASALVPAGPFGDFTLLENGDFLTGGGGSELILLKKRPVDEVAFNNRAQEALIRGVSWLLDGEDGRHTDYALEHARRLMAFGEALKVLKDEGLKQRVREAMQVSDAALRATQRGDGAWGRYNGYVSDSMVTAQVGYALDYLEPSPKDPVIQNAIKFLLSHQQADGSWSSESKVLDTRLSATTWVSIWLPIALDRIGGIDTKLTLKMPANVQLSNPSLLPTSVLNGTDGTATYQWAMQGVTANSQEVQFDLALQNLGLGENRAVASDAFLTFNNSFTGTPQQAPVGIPSVLGSAFLSVGVATDQASYPANTAVTLTAQIANPGPVANGGSVQFSVLDAGKNLVAALGTSPVINVASNGTQSTAMAWNTGVVQSGNYLAQATLLDANGKTIQVAQQAFAVVAGAAGNATAGAKLSTDKASYAANDIVQVTSRVLDLTANTPLNNLVVVTRVLNPDGSERLRKQEALAQLQAGQTKDYGYSLSLVNAPVGNYPVSLTVQDAAGVVLAQQSTQFAVDSSASNGSGVLGALTVSPNPVNQGAVIALNAGVTNKGNSALTNLPLTVRVIDPATSTVLGQWAQASSINPGQTAAQASNWTVTTAPNTKLIAVLSATFAGKEITLAQEPFTVVGASVKLDTGVRLDAGNRILVWYSCGANWWGSNSPLLANQPCFTSRKQQLQTLLNAQGVQYQIAASEAEFLQLMRGGRHNQYWLLGQIEHSKRSTLLELREMVNRGNTVVIDSSALALGNGELAALAGSSLAGTFNAASQSITLKSGLFQPGSTSSAGQPACLATASGQVQATLVGGALAVNNGCPTAPTHPAIVTNSYGKGQALLFAYDVLDTLQAGGTASTAVFNTAQASLVNTLPAAYPIGDLVPARIDVVNQGVAATLDVLSRWASGAQALYSLPAAQTTAAHADWSGMALPASQRKDFRLGFSAPAPIGQQTLGTAFATLTSTGTWLPFGNTPLLYQVVDLETLLGAANTGVQALQAGNAADVTALANAKADLARASSEARAGQYCPALLDTLGSIESVRSFTSSDIRASRLVLDDLLHELMRRATACNPPQLMDRAVLTLKDDGRFNGTSVAVNSPYGGLLNKLPVLAGGTVIASSINSQVSSSPYKAGQPATLYGEQAIVQENSNVSADGDRFFLEYFGYTKAQIRQQAYRISGSQFVTEAQAGRLNGSKGKFIWVDGDVTANLPLANIGFSAVNQPGVVLIINGKLTLNAGMSMYGVLYGIGDANGNWALNAAAPIMVNGLTAVEGNLNINASLHLVDNADYYRGLVRP